MAWIESHQELAPHPKVRRLARTLRVSIPAAIGHLPLFWWWALDYARDGPITGIEATDIAEAAMWEDGPDLFMQALIGAGFVDRDGESLRIHDWEDYAGRMMERRARNAERMRRERAAHVQRTLHARSGATVPNPTVPNPTVPPSPSLPSKETKTENPSDSLATKTPRKVTERPAWEPPEWMLPLKKLEGYKPGNHSTAATVIEDECQRRSVSPSSVVTAFVAYYPKGRVVNGWKDPVKSLPGSLDIQISK